jgi:hypothetical protein
MTRGTARIALTALMMASCSLVLVGGCAAPAPVAPGVYWVPSARPVFATLARSTTYALVHAEDRDLLVIEDERLSEGGGAIVGRYTWLVPLSLSPELEAPIAVGEEAGAPAWIIEEIHNQQTHAAPARGTIVVHEMSEDRVVATVRLSAVAEPRTAGVAEQSMLEIDAQHEFVRYAPHTPQYREMTTRRGEDSGTSGRMREGRPSDEMR